VYWFMCVPRCKVLSCGRKVTRSPMCPAQNPFRARQQLQEQQEEQEEQQEEQQQEEQEQEQQQEQQEEEQQEQREQHEQDQQQEAPSSAPSIESVVTPTRNSLDEKAKKKKKKKKKAIRSTRDGWIITNVLVVYTLSPSIIKSCFQMLQPEEVCQTKYWALDDTIKFDDDTHQMMILSVAVPSLIFYGVVCPLLVMFYIGRHADRQTNKKLMFRFGLLYSGFAPKYWFYELILFLRKLLIILVVTFASSNEQQLHIALGVLIVLLYLLEHLRPYNAENAGAEDRVIQTRLHRMESLSLVILIGMVWSAVFFVIGCNDNDGTCSALGVVVLGSNVIFALGAGYVFVKSYQKKKRWGEKLDKLTSALSMSLRGRSGSRASSTGTGGGGSRSGGEEVHFETMGSGVGDGVGGDDDEMGLCTIKINPLNSGAATRSEFAAKRRRRNSEAQREQMARSEDSSSSSNNAVTLLRRSSRGAVAAVEIEMTSAVNKTTETEEEEEQELETFVDKNSGKRYSFNGVTGQTEWLKDEECEEIEMVSEVNKTTEEEEEEEEETFVDANSGKRYSFNGVTGQTQWVTDEEE